MEEIFDICCQRKDVADFLNLKGKPETLTLKYAFRCNFSPTLKLKQIFHWTLDPLLATLNYGMFFLRVYRNDLHVILIKIRRSVVIQ